MSLKYNGKKDEMFANHRLQIRVASPSIEEKQQHCLVMLSCGFSEGNIS